MPIAVAPRAGLRRDGRVVRAGSPRVRRRRPTRGQRRRPRHAAALRATIGRAGRPHAGRTSRTVGEIARLEGREAPNDADAQRDLGLALLQRVRETADPSL